MERLAEEVQGITEDSVQLAYVYQGYTGESAVQAAEKHGIALVIDAMSELNAGRVDASCIVSGDGDFTRLVLTIKERGIPIRVFGKTSSLVSLRRGCTEFHELLDPSPTGGNQGNPHPESKAGKRSTGNPIVLKDRNEFVHLVKGLVEAGGRTTLQRVNREAVRRDQSFSSRQYGAGSLRTLLMTYGIFDLTPLKSARGIIDYEVRLKPGYENQAE